MKYCVILPSNIKSGPNNVALDIIKGIKKIDSQIEVTVLYFNEYIENKLDFPTGVKNVNISLFKSYDLEQFDIIHSHMLKPDFFVFLNKIRNKINSSKTVSTIHQKDYHNLSSDFGSRTKAFFVSILWRMILRSQDKIICLSKSMVEFYSWTLPKHKTSYIYNGRSLSDNVKVTEKFINLKKVIIGSSCYLTSRKGLEQVIKAIKYRNDIELHIAGNGPERENLENLSVREGVSNRVKFLGHSNNIEDFLNSIDIYILPSRAEGFPLSLLEAASLGKACISSRIDIVEEAFSDLELSKFQLDNQQDLLIAIDRAILKRQSYSEKIKKKHTAEFTPQRMVDNYLSLFKSML
ncbi:glycosyltransferase family 4 protein [Vibrio cyclitrophicus]